MHRNIFGHWGREMHEDPHPHCISQRAQMNRHWNVSLAQCHTLGDFLIRLETSGYLRLPSLTKCTVQEPLCCVTPAPPPEHGSRAQSSESAVAPLREVSLSSSRLSCGPEKVSFSLARPPCPIRSPINTVQMHLPGEGSHFHLCRMNRGLAILASTLGAWLEMLFKS